ncbi:MAG TPA: ATP-binding protein [Actinomycetota bacterium]|nr:ATP-binding protein [Actinomycetota bacterium]
MRNARRESEAPPAAGTSKAAQTLIDTEPRRTSHLRAVLPNERLTSLEDVERGRWHLWSVTFVLLFGLSIVTVIASYWRDSLPPSIAEMLDYGVVRFVFLALSLAFVLHVIDRERRFKQVTHALIDARARSLALEDRLRDVSALQQVLVALNSSLEMEQVLEIILRQSSRLVSATEGAVLLVDKERGVQTIASAIPEGLTGEFAIGEDLPGTVARTRLATLAEGPEQVASFPWVAGRAIATSMCAPLVAGGELIGTLILSAKGDRRFGEYDLRLLMLFAEQAAVAISNAQAYKRERESVSRLADLDRLKTDFVATITHELKTPLTSLLGYAQILRKRAVELKPEQRDEFFEIMARQGERILRLIEELLQSSRIEAGGTKLRREPLDLRAITGQLEKDLSSMSRSHGFAFDVPDHDLGLFGDATALEHVLTNLLENAIKYSGPDSTIRLSVEEQGNEIHIKIADQGQGIEPEDLPFIFERFRQTNTGTGKTRNSVGLGLYIVRSLVNAHGGRVWADSKVGQGTTFTVALPRREANGSDPAVSLQDAEQTGRLLDQVTEVP